MPDAGASRKRQIQVTPGPFNDATASGAVESARGAETGFNKAVLGRIFAFASRFAAMDLKSRQLRFVRAHSIRSRMRRYYSIDPRYGCAGPFAPYECNLIPENKGFCNYSRNLQTPPWCGNAGNNNAGLDGEPLIWARAAPVVPPEAPRQPIILTSLCACDGLTGIRRPDARFDAARQPNGKTG
jgi:hypothetical protein